MPVLSKHEELSYKAFHVWEFSHGIVKHILSRLEQGESFNVFVIREIHARYVVASYALEQVIQNLVLSQVRKIWALSLNF